MDWPHFCVITPRFMVLPGTAGNPEYKDYLFHFQGAVCGGTLSALAGLIMAGVVRLLK